MAVEKKTTEIISYQHMINWSIGLFIVLSFFFLCVWLSKKTGLLTISSQKKLRTLTALSLGVREKLVLVQVGEKQLLLAVTPSRIEKLLLLEGDERLLENTATDENENTFALKLKQAMTGTTHE